MSDGDRDHQDSGTSRCAAARQEPMSDSVDERHALAAACNKELASAGSRADCIDHSAGDGRSAKVAIPEQPVGNCRLKETRVKNKCTLTTVPRKKRKTPLDTTKREFCLIFFSENVHLPSGSSRNANRRRWKWSLTLACITSGYTNGLLGTWFCCLPCLWRHDWWILRSHGK